MRDRLLQEKANYERDEIREKYKGLDSLMRTEF